MTGQSAQIIIAQRFVNLTGKSGDNLSEAIMSTVLKTQKDVEQTGIQGATVVVRQAIVTGTLEIKATIIMDIMQVVTFAPSPSVLLDRQ